MISPEDRIRARLRMAGPEPPETVVAGFAAYLDLLTRWNRQMNLTALPLEPLNDGAIDRLLTEPYAASQYVGLSGQTVLDLGSGGGSPGIPMQIAAPGAHVVLVESKTRKAAFLREAIRQLGLGGATVENCRFEELADRGSYAVGADLVTFRAVRADDDLWKTIDVLLRPDGHVVWFGATELAGPVPFRGFRISASWTLVPTSGARAVLVERDAG